MPDAPTAMTPVPAKTAVTVTLQVVSKVAVSEGVVQLVLAAPDGGRLRDWTPGSHIDLVLPNGHVRQYSLCGDRWDPFTYRVGVLLEPSSRGGSAYLHQRLQPGDLVGVRGPRNHFGLIPADRYWFVAGGIGITPLLPMIAQADRLGAEWRLLYGGRTRASMAFTGELARYGDRVEVAAQDETGLLDLAAFVGEPEPRTAVYGCGPAPMLAALAGACVGWRPEMVRTERFVAALDAPLRTAAFEVRLARSGLTLTVGPDQSILDAVAGAGVEVLSSCGQGVCGTCETTVLSGEPDHRDSLLSADERAAGDCMYICVSRASSDVLVLDL